MTHILVVEDERHLATGIKFNLEAEGFEVTTAENGPEAIEQVQHASPPVDLMILDLMLPGMSGYAVCESLREQGVDLPILILSARTLSEDRTRGFDAGADQYLTKPFELDELLSRVNRLLKRVDRAGQLVEPPLAGNGTRCRIGTATVDLDAFEIIVDDKVENLTPLEVRLIEYFVANANRVIPRSELLEEVWHQPGNLQTRAPDQFIRRLRKLVEPEPSSPRYILTIRDGGYRYVPDPPDVAPLAEPPAAS